jgi:hypothetical protein
LLYGKDLLHVFTGDVLLVRPSTAGVRWTTTWPAACLLWPPDVVAFIRCEIETLREPTRLSHLRGDVLPGQPEDADFCWCGGLSV